MTPLEIILDAKDKTFHSELGDAFQLEVLPGLSHDEITAFEAKLPCKLPAEIREILSHSRGFNDAVISLNLTGLEFSFDRVLPYGLPIAQDPYGNFWAVDLMPNSTQFGPIYFISHDPAVVLYQSPSLDIFVKEIFNMFTPPFKSTIDDVHDDLLFNVWVKNPNVLTQAECATSSDKQLAAFANELDDSYQIIDLRNAPVGFGFSWGRYGANTVIRRFGTEPIFAYQIKKGLFKRLRDCAIRSFK